MGKKEKSKARLDKYYVMAKEHNFRSRAAFKLIQLNRKYDFLTKAKVLVDLCAAPGGWLQVASKFMPISSIKIGVDLDPIKPIKGCITFEADITTDKCISLIKNEIKHFEVDIVLNDGAPNVGAQWNKDAFGQAELVLAALKVATKLLKRGGTFVTKVFRSKDYNSLIWVLNSFFDKVESTKPAASRTQSAEIFIVCLGYKKPKAIDPKFLDPRHVFEDIPDEEEDSSKKINSLKMLLEKKRNRSGYNTDGSGAFYKETPLSEFMKCKEPYALLSTCHKFVVDPGCDEIFEIVPPPNDLKTIIEDLKVLGKYDLTTLLKFRVKYQKQIEKRLAKERRELAEKNRKELTPEEIEKENEEKLNAEILAQRKLALKKERKQREIQKKTDYLQKMSVMTSINTKNNDDELYIDPKTLARLQEVENLEDLKLDSDYESEELDEDERKELGKHIEYEDMKEDDDNSDYGEYDDDFEKKEIDRMDKEITNRLKEHKEYLINTGGETKEEKKERKKKAKGKRNLEIQAEFANQLELKKYSNKEIEHSDSEDSEELSDDDLAEIKKLSNKRAKTGEDEEFVNPLTITKKEAKKLNKVGKQTKDRDSDSDKEGFESDVEELAEKMDKEKVEEKEKKSKKKKRELKKKAKELDESKGFEVVKAEKTFSDYDSDDLAEIRALGKHMLRKKNRLDLIDNSYNRYAFNDDPNDLPSWFVEEENKYNKPMLPITRDQVEAEKKFLKDYNARPSHKIAEFKDRKKRRLLRAMAKVRQKANQIANSDELNNSSKMRQIKKLYNTEKKKIKEQNHKKKDIVVSRAFSVSAPGKTHGRKYKMVDRRLKKDTKSMKRAEKKNKGKGKRIKIRK